MAELKRLWRFIKPYKSKFLVGLCCLLVCDVLQLLVPRIFKSILEALEKGELSTNSLLKQCAAIIGIAATIAIFRWFWRHNILATSRQVERDVRRAYFKHLLTLPSAYFDQAKIGDLMARATNDVTAVQRLCGPGIFASFDGIVLCTFALAFMLRLDPWLTLVAIIPLPLITIKILILGRRIHKRAQESQEAFAALSQAVQENMAGVRVVKDFNQEEYQNDYFQQISKKYVDKNLGLVKYMSLTHPVLLFIIQISFALALLYGGQAVMVGRISLGALVAFLAYLEILIWPAIAIGWVVNLIQRGLASLGRIGTVLDTVPEIKDGTGVAEEKTNGLALEMKAVTFSYGKELKPSLKNVSFSLPWGGTLGVVGLTGSGKTTIARLLLREYEAEEGTVFVNGYSVRQYELDKLRQFFGLVPQDTFLFSGPIEENICFGADDKLAAPDIAAADAGILDEINSLPHQMSTVIGERGVTLSGGQKQRLAIARALYLNRPIVILDDCLSAVDTETEEKILRNLKKHMQERTALVVSNRISSVKHADEIIVLKEGEIIERGTHAELLSLDGLYADLHRRQQIEEWIESH